MNNLDQVSVFPNHDSVVKYKDNFEILFQQEGEAPVHNYGMSIFWFWKIKLTPKIITVWKIWKS